MARSIAALKKDHERVRKLLKELDAARGDRDGHIREAISFGVTWRDAAEAAGISSVQVGKIMRREDPDSTTGRAPTPAGRRAAG